MTYSTNTAPTNSYCNLTSTSLQRPDLLNQITTVKLSKKKLNFAQSQCDCLNFNSISDSDTFEIQPVQALLAQTTQMRAVTLSRIINVSIGTTRTSITTKKPKQFAHSMLSEGLSCKTASSSPLATVVVVGALPRAISCSDAFLLYSLRIQGIG